PADAEHHRPVAPHQRCEGALLPLADEAPQELAVGRGHVVRRGRRLPKPLDHPAHLFGSHSTGPRDDLLTLLSLDLRKARGASLFLDRGAGSNTLLFLLRLWRKLRPVGARLAGGRGCRPMGRSGWPWTTARRGALAQALQGVSSRERVV